MLPVVLFQLALSAFPTVVLHGWLLGEARCACQLYGVAICASLRGLVGGMKTLGAGCRLDYSQ